MSFFGKLFSGSTSAQPAGALRCALRGCVIPPGASYAAAEVNGVRKPVCLACASAIASDPKQKRMGGCGCGGKR